MTKSKFSKKLHAKYDRLGREAVKAFFARIGKPLQDFSDDSTIYGPDLIEPVSMKFVEVEVRSQWKTKKWPYDTIHILERKAHYLTDGLVFMAIVSKDAKHVCIVMPETLKHYIQPKYFEYVPNTRVKSGKEGFYNIPPDACFWGEVTDSSPFFGKP